MLGGGTFTSQNKVLPGTYYNVISALRAEQSFSIRGTVAMPLELDWGPDDTVFTVTREDIEKKSQELFGYMYHSPEMVWLREVFKMSNRLYGYKLNKGVKAENSMATAKYAGIRGNDIKISIQENPDSEEEAKIYDVTTYLDNVVIDIQTVKAKEELKSNDFVDFKTDITLAVTAATALENGTNGSAVTGLEHQKFLGKIESYNFNAMGVPVTDEATKKLYVAFTKRMRDEVGAKFQTVLYQASSADYEGIISMENEVEVDEAGQAFIYKTDLLGNREKVSVKGCKNTALIYWITGAIAGCNINESNTNRIYDGEFTVKAEHTQTQLENAILSGKFMLHNVSGEIRVLADINTFLTYTDNKNMYFSENQVIRVFDQDAIETAKIFNTYYLGKTQNEQDGRISFKSDLVSVAEEMQKMKAIEDFATEDIVVEKGQDKKSVLVSKSLQPVICMEKLYATVTVI